MVKKLFFDACQPCEGIFELHSCCGLIFMTVFGNFDRLVLTHQTFFQKNFWLKSLLLVSTISGQMWTEIRQPQSNSNTYIYLSAKSKVRQKRFDLNLGALMIMLLHTGSFGQFSLSLRLPWDFYYTAYEFFDGNGFISFLLYQNCPIFKMEQVFLMNLVR